MPRRFVVIGNWKCSPLSKEIAVALITVLNSTRVSEPVDIVISASPIYLATLREHLRQDWAVAAPNLYPKPSGAFTGEITAPMLAAFGVAWAIVGHSERRAAFGEADEFVAQKVAAGLEAGLRIVACIGEGRAEREGGESLAVVAAQLEGIAAAVPEGRWGSLVIAYEPLWAPAGAATPEEAQQMAKAIRAIVAEKAGDAAAAAVRIAHGGAVRPDNAGDFAEQPDIDGFLVGAASLTAGIADIAKAAARSR